MKKEEIFLVSCSNFFVGCRQDFQHLNLENFDEPRTANQVVVLMHCIMRLALAQAQAKTKFLIFQVTLFSC